MRHFAKMGKHKEILKMGIEAQILSLAIKRPTLYIL